MSTPQRPIYGAEEKILITNSGNLIENTRYINNINNLTRTQTSMYNQIMIGVGNK